MSDRADGERHPGGEAHTDSDDHDRTETTRPDGGSRGESTEGRLPTSRRTAMRLAGLAVGGIALAGGFAGPSDADGVSLPELHAMDAAGGMLSRDQSSVALSESEPNDRPATATRIETNRAVTGSAAAGEADFFAFAAAADEPLTVTFDRAPEGGLTALVVHGPEGALLDVTFVATGRTATLTPTTRATGVHSVEVAATQGDTGPYTLRVTDSDYQPPTETPTPTPTATEPSTSTSTSTPTPTPTPTSAPTPTEAPARTPTPTGPPFPIAIEAETAADGRAFEPFVVASDPDAVGGRYIVVPEGTGERRRTVPETGRARYTVTVPDDAVYALWVRIDAQSNGNSFRVAVDGGDPIYWSAAITDGWTWSPVGGASTRTLTLEAGTHTIEVIRREDGTRLDRLVLAKDLAYRPSGLGPGVDDGGSTPTGNPTKTPTQTPTPQEPEVTAYLAAESAAGAPEFAPFTVNAHPYAAGGAYIVVPNGGPGRDGPAVSDGIATYEFSVPADGTYAIWGRAIAPDGSSNSLFYRVDDGPVREWWVDRADDGGTTDWTWFQFNDRDRDAYPVTVELDAGTHTLELRRREPGTALDGVVITGDLGFEPAGPYGDGSGSAPEGTPTPTPTPTQTPTPTPAPTETPTSTPTPDDGQSPYGGSPAAAPGRIQAENFDRGGAGVAYSDADPSNQGGDYRDTGVDIQQTGDAGGGYNVGWIEDGEWLEYTVDVEGGEYDLLARVASPEGGATLVARVDGAEIGRVDVPATGAWQAYTTESGGTTALSAGEVTLRLEAVGGSFNLNWVALEATDGDSTPTRTPTPTPTPTPGDPGEATVTGDPAVWHDARLVFKGPALGERSDPNPFADYRLQVRFTGPSGQTYDVPGYFAADASAAETGATSGSKWVAHLNPDEAGAWTYEASFRTGEDVAVSLADDAGDPTGFDGAAGTFEVAESGATGRDFRAKGTILNAGGHYLTHAGTGETCLKGGPNVPENFMGYAGFDNTPDRGRGGHHEFAVHESDWRQGDPDWGNGDGRAIIGALNFVADAGGNSVYFLPNNVGGDGEETFPHLTPADDKTRYDVSKLAQWERTFTHAESRGIHLHFLLAETESGNETYYDGGELGPQRKLYYRELIARFGHHCGVQWNVGEENDFGTDRHEAFAAYLHDVDPYDHPVTTHTRTNRDEEYYGPLVGNDDIEMTSFQASWEETTMVDKVVEWRTRSADAGVPWVVSVDEPQRVDNDFDDANGYPNARTDKMWPAYMGGAGGFEWYIRTAGGSHSFDQTVEDLSNYETALNWTRHARDLLTRLPLASGDVENQDGRLSAVSTGDAYCLSDGRDTAVVYTESRTSFDVDLPSGEWRRRYYNPRTGTFEGSATVSGNTVDVDAAPFDGDAAVLFERV